MASTTISALRAELAHQEKQAGKAAMLLEQAFFTVTQAIPDEPLADRAQRLRGAAVIALTAVLELGVTCGWSEAVHAAEQNS